MFKTLRFSKFSITDAHLSLTGDLLWNLSGFLFFSSWKSRSSHVQLQSKPVNRWRWRLKTCTFRWRTSLKQNRRSVHLSLSLFLSAFLKFPCSDRTTGGSWSTLWLSLLHVVGAEKKAESVTSSGSDHPFWPRRLCFWAFYEAAPSVAAAEQRRNVKSSPSARDEGLEDTSVPSELVLSPSLRLLLLLSYF